MNISNVTWMDLHSVSDERGCLTAIEGGRMIPFDIKRVFYMHNVTKGSNRGGHAHQDTDQLAVAVHGSLKIIVSDGLESRSIILDDPRWGIILPRLTWVSLLDFSDDAVCMVLASTNYDRSKSIRTWSEYLAFRGVPQCPEITKGSILCRLEAKSKL